MDYKILQEKYVLCCQLVTSQRLVESFALLEELVKASQKGDMIIQLENFKETYNNILKYSFGKIEDPGKKAVYFHLLRTVIELADEARESIISDKLYLSYSGLRNDLQKSKLQLEDIDPLIKSLETDFSKETIENENNLSNEQQKKVIRIFQFLWLADKYCDIENKFAPQILQSEIIPWWIQCMAISAITLSLQRYFDESKLMLLANAYRNSKKQIWQRALTGLIIALYQYNSRLYLYPKIKELLEDIYNNTKIEKHFETIIIQFIKAKDTEKITQKFQEEILPEMSRLQSRIHEKLDIKNMLLDPFSDDKNPDWEHVFQDSPGLLNKLEEFSKLQVEGSDVFMSTFSMLKQFDFFNPISNWFLPFYKENPEMHEALTYNDDSFNVKDFVEEMEKSSILCNSDKYSFCLNLKFVPPGNRNSMMDLFKMEINAMQELERDDELLKKPAHERIIFTQYIQDLYRFHKLYKYKNEFYDIFSSKADFYNTGFFKWIVKDETILRNIGEFLFEKAHYKDAIDVFLQLNQGNGNFELWQKIAYCYQQLGNCKTALDYYLKADLANTRNAWNTKKIALCYRRLENYTKALDYYLEAEKLEPENLYVQANLAHTYLDLKDFENALKVYFKVEYLAPDNIKIQRPIAWCSFMLGKLDTAKKYFEKISDIEGNRHDLINLGHIEWCLGNKQGAIERYKQSIQKANSDFEWFSKEFLADSEILIRYGIDPVNISLMYDYLKILQEKEK